MKKAILILAILASTVCYSQDFYRVTAETNNLYGQNFWCDLTVEATVMYSGPAFVHNVYYHNEPVIFNRVYGERELYSVWINYETYYFRF